MPTWGTTDQKIFSHITDVKASVDQVVRCKWFWKSMKSA